MRIFKTLYDAVNEISRDLLVRGISTICKSYQDKKLEGEDQIVKELVGVDFRIDKPLYHPEDGIRYIFKEETDKIIEYCNQEVKDRCSKQPLNPGNSYKIREDMWSKFLEGTGKFSYQYAERFWTNNQFQTVIDILKKDSGTRQAVLSVWNPDKDMVKEKLGGGNRIPCSLTYQFLIRNDELHCIYNMRSNSFFEHAPIDYYIAGQLMKFVVDEVKDVYPNLKVGSLTIQVGSLHAFAWNLKKFTLF